jgi:uncharacterized protein YgbK (DUF1537 family)
LASAELVDNGRGGVHRRRQDWPRTDGIGVGLLLGCIADDLTGATDLANTLVQAGMRTIQTVGVPRAGLGELDDAAAVVVALKSRTIPATQAIEQSLAALAALQAAGMRQCLFKYCSTFDSTDAGNIGPVAEALMDALGADFTIACPAFPETGRTIYKGHLFVGDRLLSDTHMRHHPLTPMTDSNLVQVLGRQSRGEVGLVPLTIVAAGADAIAGRFAELRGEGVRLAIVDAVADTDLMEIGAACRALRLVTGGSGIALGLPRNFRRSGLLPDRAPETALPAARGYAAVIAGSCSEATREQVAHMSARRPGFRIDPLAARPADQAIAALEWARSHLADGPVLVYATAPPDEVRKAQEALGVEQAGAMIEATLATVAEGLVRDGVGRLIVAGGETAGAVMQALGVRRLRIGPQIDPGVPWTMSLDEPILHLALKSGNFGSTDFFLKALDQLG